MDNFNNETSQPKRTMWEKEFNLIMLNVGVVLSVFLYMFAPAFMVLGNPFYAIVGLISVLYACFLIYKPDTTTVGILFVIFLGLVIWGR